ncbi:hypothetical protein [Rhizosaccharibacter radicis]|uniref:Uncharacterized protein n=1 Tax=Rhizosaccharibacter radicis TaxID=2782605 RepID=A0ABT1VW44_9PROT|nr:hypothetical protein [Acetobacteraceae bacterium KSS12]
MSSRRPSSHLTPAERRRRVSAFFSRPRPEAITIATAPHVGGGAHGAPAAAPCPLSLVTVEAARAGLAPVQFLRGDGAVAATLWQRAEAAR